MKPKEVFTGMDARLAQSVQVGFIRLLCLESLVKHIGHGDACDANHILEHIYFIGVVLLLSLLSKALMNGMTSDEL